MTRTATSPDHSQVVVFPPLIPLTGFLVGVVLQHLVPFGPWLASRTIVRGLGVLIALAGASGFAWMVATMKRARTPIHNAQPPTSLVETGPFRFTRNPMYLCGSIVYAGMSVTLFEPWSLMLLPAVLVATHYAVVIREEAFLERRFGAAYLRYKAQVPRWW